MALPGAGRGQAEQALGEAAAGRGDWPPLCWEPQGSAGLWQPGEVDGFGLWHKSWWGSQATPKNTPVLQPGKGVGEKLDPSLNYSWVFGVLVSSGLLAQGLNVSGSMDAYKYPVTYVLTC